MGHSIVISGCDELGLLFHQRAQPAILLHDPQLYFRFSASRDNGRCVHAGQNGERQGGSRVPSGPVGEQLPDTFQRVRRFDFDNDLKRCFVADGYITPSAVRRGNLRVDGVIVRSKLLRERVSENRFRHRWYGLFALRYRAHQARRQVLLPTHERRRWGRLPGYMGTRPHGASSSSNRRKDALVATIVKLGEFRARFARLVTLSNLGILGGGEHPLAHSVGPRLDAVAPQDQHDPGGANAERLADHLHGPAHSVEATDGCLLGPGQSYATGSRYCGQVNPLKRSAWLAWALR